MAPRLPDPPGPRGHPLLGSAPAFWRDPVRTMLEAAREYGDVVHFPLGGPFHGYLLSHPDHVRHVLQEHYARYTKPPYQMAKLKTLVGEGVLTAEGESWLRQRRLTQPAFHRQRIAGLGTTMIGAALELLPSWEEAAGSGRPLDMAQEMMRLTLTIVGRTLLGAEVSGDAAAVGEAVTLALEHINRRMQSYFDPDVLPLPLPAARRYRRARERLDEVVYRVIEERRRSTPRGPSGDAWSDPARGDGRPPDLLDLLLQARDAETGQGMTDLQLRDEVMTIFLAGHETTANLLTWAFYLLSTHPEIERRLRAEWDSVLAGRPPAAGDLPRLRYTTMTIEEVLRLYPPAWALSRTPLGDDAIGGYRIRAGSLVFISPYVTHRHSRFWPNPEGFDPERFAPEGAAVRPRFAYFPFGGGPRQCIGNSFAMMEAQLLLPTLLRGFHLDALPGHPVSLQPLITLRPRYGMLMTLRRARGTGGFAP